MSQATFDDDELFSEAASEMREDVQTHLDAAREELPQVEAIWETDADNILGAINGLKSALDVGDAEAELKQAKKWYVMGKQADAFEDADDLEAEIEAVESVVSEITTARSQVTELAGTIPALRNELEAAHGGDEE